MPGAGYSLLSKKHPMVEKNTIAQDLAQLVANALKQLGVDPAGISAEWVVEPAAGDGVNDADHRKAVIDIKL
jgi:hypothetical protein